MPPTLVEMNECRFQWIKRGNEILKTLGVSTCLCFMFYGRDKSHSFIGMHHWSGFPADFDGSEDSAMDEIFELIEDIEHEARTQLGGTLDRTLTLDKLIIMGGERRQVDADGELLVSGTEREVNALIDFVKPACNTYFQLPPTFACIISSFKTTGDQCMDIMMDKDRIAWDIIESDVSEEDVYLQEEAARTSSPKVAP
ncbi:hypothetical protein [Legionella nagasakiensis]|uniref:hypothetical protein n=1 Tax=Legionella nagasakiensis TaxID=535290 RepID=UPI00105597B2|nr:hypothetical protein [Legionella nagasakiensis]